MERKSLEDLRDLLQELYRSGELFEEEELTIVDALSIVCDILFDVITEPVKQLQMDI